MDLLVHLDLQRQKLHAHKPKKNYRKGQLYLNLELVLDKVVILNVDLICVKLLSKVGWRCSHENKDLHPYYLQDAPRVFELDMNRIHFQSCLGFRRHGLLWTKMVG